MKKQSDKNRVLVVGLPKSGTTILTYRIAHCYTKCKIFFEPGKSKCLSDPEIHKKIIKNPINSLVTKCLYVPSEEIKLDEIETLYDKKVFIYRDPRDWIISSYLYKWRQLNEQNVENTIKRIRRKEDQPQKISFANLLPKQSRNKFIHAYDQLTQELSALDDSWLKLKYESFVDNELDALNDYLGVNIDTSVEVDKKFDRVARSKYYGNWRKWFNSDDVAYYKEMINPILSILEYDTSDWNTELPEKLDPALGSEYLYNLYKLKRNE